MTCFPNRSTSTSRSSCWGLSSVSRLVPSQDCNAAWRKRGSLSGISRFFARSPWDTEALAARWQERFRTQMTPVVQSELARQQEVQPKRRGRAISTRCHWVSDWRRFDHATCEKGRKMEGKGRASQHHPQRRVRGHNLVQGLDIRGFATLPSGSASLSATTRL